MDITHPAYRFYGERVIRKLLEVSAHRKCVIGFQLDNETKHYDTAGKNVQEQFVKYLREKFHNDLNAMNYEFGLEYWSNRINAWEDFPDIRGTINGSLGAEFEKFRRTLVDEYLEWQAAIVQDYARKDQFITHNFDFGWKNGSYGVQPAVNHYHGARALTVAGVDIYHPTQDDLTGADISYCGDSARSLKQDNYFVLETEAQGFPQWLPYEGQLRLQAYSHLASGANMVEYWHWHSIHNACETYWKGILSHDFKENDTYRAVKVIGNELKQIGSRLVNLKKRNKAAVLVSNEALTAPEELLERIDAYVKNDGHIFATFKTGFANENLKVYANSQPHGIDRCLGLSYSHFTHPKNVRLTAEHYRCPEREVRNFMELLNPTTAQVLASYDHYNWKRYAAVTRNRYGKGTAFYLGCQTGESMLREILCEVIRDAGLWSREQEIAFPVILKKGVNDYGMEILYYLNYSPEVQKLSYRGDAAEVLLANGKSLPAGEKIYDGAEIMLEPWNLMILER